MEAEIHTTRYFILQVKCLLNSDRVRLNALRLYSMRGNYEVRILRKIPPLPVRGRAKYVLNFPSKVPLISDRSQPKRQSLYRRRGECEV